MYGSTLLWIGRGPKAKGNLVTDLIHEHKRDVLLTTGVDALLDFLVVVNGKFRPYQKRVENQKWEGGIS